MIEHEYSSRIQISAHGNAVKMFVDKIETNPPSTGSPKIIGVTRAEISDGLYKITYNSGIRIELFKEQTRNSEKYFWSLAVHIPGSICSKENDIIGIFGTPNGKKNDDFTAKNGQVLPIPSGYDKTDYATENWCIRREDNSLFAYEVGESLQSFSDCDRLYKFGGVPFAAPVGTPEAFPLGDIAGGGPIMSAARLFLSEVEIFTEDAEEPSEEIELVCEGNEDCIFDGMRLGIEGAKNYIQNIDIVEASIRKQSVIVASPSPSASPSPFSCDCRSSDLVTIGKQCVNYCFKAFQQETFPSLDSAIEEILS